MPAPPLAAALLLARAAAAASGRRLLWSAATAHAAGSTTQAAGRWAPAAASAAFSGPSAAFARGVSTSGRADAGDDGKDDPPPPSPADGSLWRSWIDSQLNELDRGTAPPGEAPPGSPPGGEADDDADAAATTAAATTAAAAAPAETATAAATTATTPPPAPPTRVTVSQPPPSALPSPVAGYSELGVTLEDAVADALAGGPAAAAAAAPAPAADAADGGAGPYPPGARDAGFVTPTGRLHPGRLFYPGMTYSPSDLVAEEGSGGGGGGGGGNGAASASASAIPGFTGSTAAAFAARPPVSGVPPPGALRATATDFRNAPVLASLLSATGKLPPRRRTRLAAKDHRSLARSVKLARSLALIAPLGRETVAGGPPRPGPPRPKAGLVRREGGVAMTLSSQGEGGAKREEGGGGGGGGEVASASG